MSEKNGNVCVPKINFVKLKGFPVIQAEHTKIPTEEFLRASSEIVSVVESFGTLFTPVVYDMNGNIEKIRKCFDKNKELHFYLEDLIILSKDDPNSNAGISLLWLKRALELLAAFLRNIVSDENVSDSLKEYLKDAYEETLKPFHGWFVQQTFSLIYRWVPTRSQIIGVADKHAENIKSLKLLLPRMQTNLKHIHKLLVNQNMYDNKKV